MTIRQKILLIPLVFIILPVQLVQSAEPIPKELENIGIRPSLGISLSLSTTFQDEQGKTVPLKKYFDGTRPVVIVMTYYGCPMLCGILLNALRESVEQLSWKLGEKYQVLAISIDPREDFQLAASSKKKFFESWEEKESTKHWHFLTGKGAKKTASELGFGYRFNPEQNDFAHGAGIFILSPKGKLSRVLYGSNYGGQNLKLALLEASKGKVGTITERILLFCYNYSPKENRYVLLASRLMKAGGGVTVVLILLTYITLFIRRRYFLKRGKP